MSKRIVLMRSNPIAPSPRVEKAAAALAGAGYQVSILGWDRACALDRHDVINGIPITRFAIPASYGSGIRNLIPLLRWQLALLFWLVRNITQFDVVHAFDFDSVLPGFLCKLIFGKKVLYEICDFYADHVRVSSAPIKNLIRKIDWFVIEHVDAVILADESRLPQIAPAKPKLLEFIYNTPPDIYPTLPETQKPGDRFTLAYVGVLQTDRGLMEMIDLVAKYPQWQFRMAGFGGDQELILRRARQVKNVIWEGRLDYAAALRLYVEADVVLALYDPKIANNRYASPNKIFEAMMLGKPVITAEKTTIAPLVSDHQIGMAVDYHDLGELETALVGLSQNPDRRTELGRSGRKLYETRFDWQFMQEKLLRLYKLIEQ